MRASRHLLSGPNKRKAPEYPDEAKKKGIAGIVEVLVYVDEDGKVYKAKICKGHPLLRKASIEAAFKAEFLPTTYNGKPVKVMTLLTYTFENEN